jgi:hypothetical protein
MGSRRAKILVVGAVAKGGDAREFVAEVDRLMTARTSEKKLRS